MQRRELLKQTALTLAAFTLSRHMFAAEAEKFIQLPDVEKIIKLSSNENPHGPSPMARKEMMNAVNGDPRLGEGRHQRARQAAGDDLPHRLKVQRRLP